MAVFPTQPLSSRRYTWKDSPKVQQLVRDICDGAVEAVVLLTGVGTRALVETADAMGRQEEFIRALDQRTIIARSPKQPGCFEAIKCTSTSCRLNHIPPKT